MVWHPLSITQLTLKALGQPVDESKEAALWLALELGHRAAQHFRSGPGTSRINGRVVSIPLMHALLGLLRYIWQSRGV